MATTPPLTDTEFENLPASDPQSPFYLPPIGYYQNDAGVLVPNSTPNSTSSTPSAQSTSNTSSLKANLASALASIASVASPVPFPSISLEDVTVIIVGLILIAAGVFAFKSTQTVIQTTGRIARAGAEAIAP